eukprot:409777_1
MSSLLSKQDIERIDHRCKCLVFGFIKISQKILPTSHQFYIIPDLVLYLILSYYYGNYEWSETNKGAFILSNFNKTVQWKDHATTTAFGATDLLQGETYKIKIKIIKLPDNWCVIGIIDSDSKLEYGAHYELNSYGYSS